MSVIDKAVAYMVDLVTDPIHGYDQINRWGPNFDCSSSIIQSWDKGAGVPVKAAGASYTGNMRAAFTKCGFSVIPYKKGMSLVKGDIILNERHHTVMYIGDGKIAQFSINEKGTTKGGKTGDQTGKESYIGKFYEYSKGWDCVLRYPGDDNKQEDKTVNITMPVLQNGSRCAEVGTVQTLLNALGFKGKNGRPLTVDRDFGQNVDYAVRLFQKSKDLTPDGIIGSKTWKALLTSI